MKNARRWGRTLLWVHLFVCVVWLYLLKSDDPQPPNWMVHVLLWSILGIQFTWGFTVGLLVGPSRKKRQMLLWSLLPIFMPLCLVLPVCIGIAIHLNPLIALVYLAFFMMILACETYCGLLLGAKQSRHVESD